MRFLLICFFVFIGCKMEAQVGVNTISPQAQLDIRSSNQATPSNTDGILIPKIDAFPVTNPTAAQTGMLVYLTTLSGANQPGFYYWDNASVSWIALKGTSDADWYEVGGTTAPNNINDTMYHLGNVAIGKSTALYPLEVDSNDAEIGVNSSMTTSSTLTARKGFQNVISGTSNDLMYGIYNQVRPSGTGIHYGNYTLMSGTNSTEKYGTYNRVINGAGTKFGSYNYISGGGNSLYGNYNFIENGSAFFQYGTFNQISNTNDTYKIGVNNGISGAGNSSHIGVANSLSGTGIGEQVGVDNQILNNGNGFQYGVRNFFSNTSTGEKKGLTTTFSNTQGDDYGIEHTFNSTGTAGDQYGMRNLFFGNKSGTMYGIRNDFNGSGGVARVGLFNNIFGNSVQRVGVQNFITASGTGESKGTYTRLGGSSSGAMYGHDVDFDYLDCGTGNKYGYRVTIPLVTCGVHYGIYSNVEKANSYAGFFQGRVSIGSSGLVTDNYILPLSRGTNGQIMQTDGVGNVTWQNPNTALNNNFWSTTGNTGLPSTAFIGNTDNVSLKFRVNNVPAGLISGELDTKNTYLGYNSGAANTGNSNNVGIGFESLRSLIGNGLGGGAFNVAVGNESLSSSIDGSFNVAVGYNALRLNTSGNSNCAIGEGALQNNITGSYNIALGNFAGSGELGSNKLYIGSGIPLIYGELDNQILRSNSQRFFINDPVVNGIQMMLKNSNRYLHFVDANLNFGTAGGNFLMATSEGLSETAGIRGDGDNISIWSPGDGNRQLRILDEDLWNDNDGNPYNNGAEVAYIAANGQYFQVSDRNKKENIKKIDNALNKISTISGYTYQFKLKSAEIEKGEKPAVSSGVLAQEIEFVLPEAIQKNEYGEYFVDYAAITPLLIEAIKEQNTKIHSLEERLKQLEEKLSK